MISLNDQQLDVDRCQRHRAGAPERFPRAVAAMLKVRYRFNDDDVAEVTALALHGLIQTADSAA